MALLSYFFYRSVIAMIPMTLAGVFLYRKLRDRKIKKNRETLERQFKECILSVSTSIRAGYAVENAFRESEDDMKRMFGKESFIVTELSVIRRGLIMNIPLETILYNLAERSGSQHIEQFAQVFEIAKRSGGNMSEVIRSSAELIGRDIDARTEMQTVLSGRKMEQNIMKAVPFAIVIYIDFSNKGYFDGLYGNLRGVAIMTGCLAVYLAGYFMGDKILGKLEKEM
ncbi:MAG: type II secretion system F family protein [Lachnospiraceae bacterium]|nr:type II secretion system F family protein [Lachnospiraceae bacterium]